MGYDIIFFGKIIMKESREIELKPTITNTFFKTGVLILIIILGKLFLGLLTMVRLSGWNK